MKVCQTNGRGRFVPSLGPPDSGPEEKGDIVKHDVYQEVTDRIVASLKKGTVPWKKPWDMIGGYPFSLSTGKTYRGINLILLALEGYNDPRWGTFKAIKEAAIIEARRQGREIVIDELGRAWEIVDGQSVWFDGGVRKGEKGTHIVFWRRVERKKPKEGEDANYWLLRNFVVFNATQADGLPDLPEREVRDFTPIQKAEEIVSGYVWTPGSGNTGPPALFGYDHASYNLGTDIIELPDPTQFHEDEAYYTTLFHELVHSTGSAKRLKRITPALFGSDPYAKEELVAEIGASFLAGLAEFEGAGGEQSAAYIANWLERIQGQPKLVVQAAAQAQKAVDLIVGTRFDDEESTQPETALEAVAA